MKIAIIACYFGELPNYIELWLQSCEANSEIQFFLITDEKVEYYVPSNVAIISRTWAEIVDLIGSKFPFSISLETPYKLTDFKPAYGYIFENLLQTFDYWGYCDLDMVFGNIMNYLEKPINDNKEKIYRLGHLTIYKNIDKTKYLFSKKGGMFSYKEVFSKPYFYSFDEHAGQMMIAKNNSVNEYYSEDMADISCRINRMTASRHDNYQHQVFYYENGAVYRAYERNGVIYSEEFIYIHFQKRKYKTPVKYNKFYILSNMFENKEESGVPGIDTVRRLSEFISEENDKQQMEDYKSKKVREFIISPINKKIIWLKIKIAEKCV